MTESGTWLCGHVHQSTPIPAANKTTQVQYDWVFGTDYQGELATVDAAAINTEASASTEPFDAGAGTELEAVDGEEDSAAGAAQWEPAGPGVIDRGMLQATEQPILFYADVPLYEDELHDHGAVQLAAKIRVMPTCVSWVYCGFVCGFVGSPRFNRVDI